MADLDARLASMRASSEKVKLPREFVQDAALAEQYWLEDGDTQEGIAEWKSWVRANWHDDDFRELETLRIKQIADFMRELQGMANGITHRIKERIANEKSTRQAA